MHKASLECDGNTAVLNLVTHFGQSVCVQCKKTDAEAFLLTYTGVNEICIAQGIVECVFDSCVGIKVDGREIRALRVNDDKFVVGQLAWVTEHYHLYMEHDKPTWMATLAPLDDARTLFVNVDCVDGGGNLMKRYRVSPFTGSWRIL